MRKRKLFFIVIAALLVFSGCGKKQENVYIESTNGYYYISAPGSYESAQTGELNSAACLEVYNKDRSAYVMAIMEDKAGFENIDFEAFTDYVKRNIESNYGVELSQEADVAISGSGAHVYRFETTSQGVHMLMWCYTVETENAYGQIYTWTLRSLEEEFAEELQAIALSFKEGRAPTEEK